MRSVFISRPSWLRGAGTARRSRRRMLSPKQSSARQPDGRSSPAGPDSEPSTTPADRQARPAPAEIQAKAGDNANAAVESEGHRLTRRSGLGLPLLVRLLGGTQ